MIKKMIYGMFLCTMFVSCTTTGITSKTSDAWTYNKPSRCTLKVGSIQVDKSASYSVEHEIAVLLPLMFLEKRIVFEADGKPADYVVDVHASERDYTSGWNIRKSMSMEVYLRRNNEANEAPSGMEEGHPAAAAEKKIVITEPLKKGTVFEVVTPDAAARIRAAGKLGFSSSKNLEYLLRVCVRKASAQLKRSMSWKDK